MKSNRALVLSFLAVATAVAALWWTNGAIAPQQATWNDAVAEAKNGGYRLITTSELAERYAQRESDLILVDTRQDWEYRGGHIKGAVHFPMEPTWWSRWRKADSLKDLLGPDKDRTLVFY